MGKHIFDPFFVLKHPIFKAFWDSRRAKTGHHELKTRQKHLFWHSMWSRIIFEKCQFFFLHPVHHVDPFWQPPLWATTCTLPQPTGPRYGGLGVGEVNFEGWKPPKVGGCGWIRCARNRVLSHLAQEMACFWFGAPGGQCAQIVGLTGAFGGLFVDILWSQRALEGPLAPGSLAACVE